MNYEELVKALRYCSTTEGMVYCNVNCKYGWEERSGGCKDILMTDAAAAIEALETEIRESMQKCAECGDAQEQKAKELQARLGEAENSVERWKDMYLTKNEPKRGEWIYHPKDAIEMMFTLPKCSICGHESSDALNYCPNCGAKMEVQE